MSALRLRVDVRQQIEVIEISLGHIHGDILNAVVEHQIERVVPRDEELLDLAHVLELRIPIGPHGDVQRVLHLDAAGIERVVHAVAGILVREEIGQISLPVADGGDKVFTPEIEGLGIDIVPGGGFPPVRAMSSAGGASVFPF